MNTRTNTDHVVAVPDAFECLHCGLRYLPNLPMPLAVYCESAKGYALMHKHCQKRPEPSKQVALFDELAKKETNHTRVIRNEHGDKICDCDLPRGTPHDCESERKVDGAIAFIDEKDVRSIDASTDDPAPEIDPPCTSKELIEAAEAMGYYDAENFDPEHDKAELTDYAPSDESFEKAFPIARDEFQLRADLAIVLQRFEGSLLPSAPTVAGWHPSTLRFQKAAAWVRNELADMNRKEHPELERFLPTERQPIPEELSALVFPGPKTRKGARPLANPRKKRASA